MPYHAMAMLFCYEARGEIIKDKEGSGYESKHHLLKENVTFFKMKAIGIYEHLKTLPILLTQEIISQRQRLYFNTCL
jgi:hypothetical protein